MLAIKFASSNKRSTIPKHMIPSNLQAQVFPRQVIPFVTYLTQQQAAANLIQVLIFWGGPPQLESKRQD